MKLAVMDPADPDGELVAHSPSSGQISMIPITQSVMALANCYCPNVCFASRLMGPERKDDLCVSTVSIVCGPYWAPAGVGASQVDSCRRKRDMPDLRAVVLSRLRIHYR